MTVSQGIAIARAVVFIFGLALGIGVPGVTTQTPEQPAPVTSPAKGVLGTGLMGVALAIPAGQKNDDKKLL